MNRLTLIVLSVLLISLSSCEYNSPEFLEKNLHWVPYRLNDTLKYTCREATFDLVVTDFYKNPASSYRGLAMDVKYDQLAYYKTNENLLYGYKIEEKYDNTLGTLAMSIKITEKDYFVFNPNIVENTDSMKIKLYSDTIINGISYQNVYVLEKDTVKLKPRISEVIKSESKGVIQFYDFSTKKKWNLENR